MIIESRAFARAGLLGNPSDGYFGKTISLSVKNFGAHVTMYETPELCIEPQPQDRNVYKNMNDLVESVKAVGYYGGDRLVKAAIKKFFEFCEDVDWVLPKRNFTVRYHSSIPRQIGLAGSSAIITATMRALMRFYEVDIPLEILPSVVLSAETDELGITAGLQDRVVQSYEGCVYMNFDRHIMEERGHGDYQRLDPGLLPPLFIAYRQQLKKVSGVVLNDLRTRWEAGDTFVHETLGQIAGCAEAGREALERHDASRLKTLIDRNCDLRRSVVKMSAGNNELVDTARNCGACATFTGSGGAVIGLYESEEMLTRLIVEFRKINARVIRPYIS